MLSKSDALFPTFIVPLFLLVFLRFILPIPFNFTTHAPKPHQKISIRYDYAANDSGGKVLDHSSMMSGSGGILRGDRDRYMVVPCHLGEKWVDISLSEDISIDEFMIIQGEIYSSPFKEIELFGSTEYPPQNWIPIGNFTLEESQNLQKFKTTPIWVRFLKLVLKTHYGNEYYCSLTQFSVFGSNVLKTINDDYKAKKEALEEKRNQKQNLLQDFHNGSNINSPLEKLRKYRRVSLDLPKSPLKFVIKDEYTLYKTLEFEDICSHDFVWFFKNVTYEEKKPTNSNVPAPVESKLVPYESTFDPFRAMIDSIAVTERKLDELEAFTDLFVELAEHNQVIVDKLNHDLESANENNKALENDFMTDALEKARSLDILQSEIDSLRISLKDIQSEQNEKNEKIENLNYLVYLLVILYVITIGVFACYFAYRLQNSIKPKENIKIPHHQKNNSTMLIKNSELPKAKCFTPKSSVSDLDFEVKFVKNASKGHNTQIPKRKR